MSHLVPYPDELYAKVAAYAARHGQSADQLLLDLAAKAIADETLDDSDQGIIPDDDPFFQLAGIIESHDPGWSKRHDEYVAEALADNHNHI